MKRLLIVIFIFFQDETFGQFKRDLEGVWYAKPLAYEFKQYGTANIYEREEMPGWKQRMKIDHSGNYEFVIRSSIQADTVYGTVSCMGDTLIFQSSTNGSQVEERYIAYSLAKDRLIYSNRRISNNVDHDNSNTLFSPIEVDGRFKFGEDSLLTLIYRNIIPVQRDSVYLNTYKLMLDAKGEARPGTITRVEGPQDYTRELQKIIEGHKLNFSPAMQNGRAVNSQLVIKFTL